MTLFAITRDVSPDMSACELSFVDRTAIDPALAHGQHVEYQRLLAQLGCSVISLPPQSSLPDAVFVEDTALVLDELAVLTRPGAASRRLEVQSVAEALAPYRQQLVSITGDGTLEGGDILRNGKQIYVGLGARSNAEGIRQLASLLSGYGYSVAAIAIDQCLHLKSAVTLLAEETVLVNPQWVDAGHFAKLRKIEVHPSEPHAANGLRVGGSVLYPSCFPRTMERLSAAGIHITPVDVSELQKAEGAVTCCSLLFEASAPMA